MEAPRQKRAYCKRGTGATAKKKQALAKGGLSKMYAGRGGAPARFQEQDRETALKVAQHAGHQLRSTWNSEVVLKCVNALLVISREIDVPVVEVGSCHFDDGTPLLDGLASALDRCLPYDCARAGLLGARDGRRGGLLLGRDGGGARSELELGKRREDAGKRAREETPAALLRDSSRVGPFGDSGGGVGGRGGGGGSALGLHDAGLKKRMLPDEFGKARRGVTNASRSDCSSVSDNEDASRNSNERRSRLGSTENARGRAVAWEEWRQDGRNTRLRKKKAAERKSPRVSFSVQSALARRPSGFISFASSAHFFSSD